MSTIADNSNTLFEWISAHNIELALFVSAVTAVISLWANCQNRKYYRESIQPQLSMKLLEYDNWLYLMIKNTGQLPAENITITLEKIINNGNTNEFLLDKLFDTSFELYPEEMVEGKVTMLDGKMSRKSFPQITIKVSYGKTGWFSKKQKYTRTVTYQGGPTDKIYANVNLDTKSLKKL